MNILHSLFSILPSQPVYAHCDIPCGIYDPHNMQTASHTVIRMTSMIQDLNEEDDSEQSEKKYTHQLSRLTKVKEDHAEILKRELQVLWSDYFKEEHLEKFPDLHDLVWKTMKLASKTKQEINLDAANELLENTQKIAEIFFQTKNLEPVRIPSLYPTEGEIVSHK
ncbi:MAG: Superoxide dismutase, Ni [uncultured bacterium]|uniref:Superoxide dismutase, Ni n=2 Tax=Candidatus Daviesiibacteriota TaxID=1752718 RepID=A0A1F5K5I0_9BACT|nr:MAG: Superoxide dismutase, Ni [uncultured bacterium]OGE33033.1 MAG: superoxide dismutase, Ni [Candidatus Daviesbacteria bacterium RIFCSPHIGHO2_02_FULL_37_9]OGE36216.1 MAG: superoxide dismutase, Ni [Candidatus Daviesbacteria bacterium RIFCSPHIGHO2_12_FULL_37_16]